MEAKLALLLPELLASSSLGQKEYSVPAQAPLSGLPQVDSPKPAIVKKQSAELGDEESEMPIELGEESALADLKERGEDVVIAKALNKVEEESTKKALPPLNQLIPQIPENIQEALEDIFRAKWVRVIRVKKRELFSGP